MLVAAKKWFWHLKLVILLFCSTTSTTINRAAFAQIIPDNTLDASQSHVTPAGVRDLITGGAIRDTTLFHSFREFNVNNGQQVYFANPANIANILTRVTGSNISRIFGTLGVDGGANLFLINPNGIIFGSNARLDVAGSFTATTANSIIFNNYEFSATNPTVPPLLKINVTPGLQYGIIHPQGQIGNQGNLSVGQDLTLISGNLNLQGQLGAGNAIYLVAENTVTIRDSTSQAGTVAINTLGIDRSRGLTELPSALTDLSNQIVAGCPARPESRFVITGRGGLPEDPRATLRGIVVVQDFRTGVGLSSLIPTGRGSDNAKLPLIEAQSWVVDALGNIKLVANTTNINGSYRRSGVTQPCV